MTLWLDAQLSPAIAPWLRMRFDVEAVAARDLGLREAEDSVIFAAAKRAGVVVVTKDSDFVELLDRFGRVNRWWRLGTHGNPYCGFR